MRKTSLLTSNYPTRYYLSYLIRRALLSCLLRYLTRRALLSCLLRYLEIEKSTSKLLIIRALLSYPTLRCLEIEKGAYTLSTIRALLSCQIRIVDILNYRRVLLRYRAIKHVSCYPQELEYYIYISNS